MTHSALLDSRTVLQVCGDDSVSFLQNLITCDVENLSAGDATFGALLSPQGKILFDFFVLRTTDGFHLDVDQAVISELAKRLTFYKLRAAVDIDQMDLSVHAVWGDNKRDKQDVGFVDPRYASMGYRLYGQAKTTNKSESDWHAARIALGMPQSVLDFQLGSVFPHEVLMDQFGGVDFSKGCYVGQEVVSRMQHRGTARSRVVCALAPAATHFPKAGTEVLSLGRRIGKLGSSNGTSALALVRIDRVANAFAEKNQITVNDIPLELKRPEFAHFEWPDEQI